MTTARTTLLTAGLAAAACLGAPAGAFGHSAVFTTETKTFTGTPPTYEDGAKQYLVYNHGFLKVLRETNQISDGGILNFRVMPGAWRTANPDKASWFANGGTGAQPHATCIGVAALEQQSTVLSWQDADPFYTYIPWQKTAAGLDDESKVAGWIAAVKAATGVDLATLPDEPAAATAAATARCTELGGTYKAADELVTAGASFASGHVAAATGPLETKLTEQTSLLDAANAKATVAQQQSAASAQLVAGLSTALSVKAASAPISVKAFANGGLAAAVSGPVGASFSVAVTVSKGQKKRRKLPSTTVATASGKLDAQGTALVKLQPKGTAKQQLRSAKGQLPLTLKVQRSESSTATTMIGG